MDVGTVVSHYRVVEHIGRGGMADVWSARDTRLNRMVAIKTIQAGLTGDVDPVRLFEHEAKTIAQLEHPHILPIYDFGEIEGQLYIVMRYVTGGSLEDVLERGPMPFSEVLRVGQAVSSALDYAHMNKVVHLDLKPPNILLDSQNAPYLADFGLAAVLGPEGRAANPGSGTLLYMAPEQLTEEQIDHRADIYSFAVMVFHMLTGSLPFDATQPLALKQLQYQESIPDVDLINNHVPPNVTSALRRGTAVDPAQRPATLTALFEELRDALSGTGGVTVTSDEWGEYGEVLADAGDMLTEPMIETDDMALLEAVDLYSRARHAWARGTGRFLLGVTHYMLMSGYYAQAERYGLDVDESGLQMLLRGALEYDHDLEFWWGKLNNENRRWVCLHAVRSENAPARIRALFRLETLPDSDAQQIPRIVAQALQAETTEDGKLAAIRVLGTRSRLMAARPEYDIQTQFRARLLTSLTRISVQARSPGEWREAVYTPEIDKLLAEVALSDRSPVVAETAARTIGQMRSLAAVRLLAEQQRGGSRRALQALALVRDEAPSLPPIVDQRGRIYAWIANTWRRTSEQSMSVVWRFVFAFIGSWLAIGTSVYLTYRNPAILHPMRMGSALGFGLIYGLISALLVILAGEVPLRLRGFWTWWTRLLVSVGFGFLLGTLAWSAYSYLFLYAVPDWDLMFFGGVAVAFGVIVSSQFNIRGWSALGLMALVFFLSIYYPYYNFCRVVYICTDAPAFSPTPLPLLALLIGAAVVLAASKQNPNVPRAFTFSVSWAWWVKIAVSVGLGALWALVVWGGYALALSDHVLTWTGYGIVFLASALIGILVMGSFGTKERVGFFAAAVLAFLAAYASWDFYLRDVPLFPMVGGSPISLLYYDFFEQIFTIGIPVAITMGLGAHALTLFNSVTRFVGPPATERERPEALTIYLVAMFIFSSLALYVSLFSVDMSLAKGLTYALRGLDVVLGYPLLAAMVLLLPFYILWAGGTLLATLGVWRWKRWGAYGLVTSLAFFVVYRAALAWMLLQTQVPNEEGELVAQSLPAGDALLLLGGLAFLLGGVYLMRPLLPQMALTIGTPRPKVQPAPVRTPISTPAVITDADIDQPRVPRSADLSTSLDPSGQSTFDDEATLHDSGNDPTEPERGDWQP
ncbi:MAG: protein kinase [Anaerolineae bacterium]